MHGDIIPETKNPRRASGTFLLCFFVHDVNFAPFTKFTEFKAIFQSLFILVTLIADALAFFALQFDEVIL